MPPDASSGADPRFSRKPLPDKVMRLTVKLLMKVQKFEDRSDTRQRLKGAAPPSRPWEHVDCGAVLHELHNFFECVCGVCPCRRRCLCYRAA